MKIESQKEKIFNKQINSKSKLFFSEILKIQTFLYLAQF